MGLHDIKVTVESPARGSNPQQPFTFFAQSASVTWSWGLQPAIAMIDWVSVGPYTALIPEAEMRIDLAGGLGNGGQTFWGFATEVTPSLDPQGGQRLVQKFVDHREYLGWDTVFGRFNRRINKLENGVYVKYYEHILPLNTGPSYQKTYTRIPYTAIEVLDFIFAAPSVGSPWQRGYLGYQAVLNLSNPIYEIDFESGRKLGELASEISERMGTVFTLMNAPYELVWTVKGYGDLSSPPAGAMNIRGLGLSLSGHPSRVMAVGDRSVYQVLEIPMVPDWQRAYEYYYEPAHLSDAIFFNLTTDAAIGSIPAGTPYDAVPGDLNQLIGPGKLANDRAARMTVGEFADLFAGGNAAFQDFRKFSGRSRMTMPVLLYIRTLVFRAFRPPVGFTVKNAAGKFVDVYSHEIQDRSVVEVSHDPGTGAMSWDVDVVTATNGYCIVQAFQIGQEGFKTLHPERFNPDDWVSSQNIWARASFQIDDSGEGTQFIILDVPAIRAGDLIAKALFDGTLQNYPVLSDNPTYQIPAVMAALTFACERFNYTLGFGSKDEAIQVGGLNGEFVEYYGSAGSPQELPYADGQTATQKADAVLEPLVARQYFYQSGGWQLAGSAGTQLSSMIDRVTLNIDGQQGTTETVDYTNERTTNVNAFGQLILTPEREFERRQALQPLLPGQKELKIEAADARAAAVALKAFPQGLRVIAWEYDLLYGYDAPTTAIPFMSSSAIAVPVGSPLWRKSADPLPQIPSPSTVLNNSDNPQYMGCMARDKSTAKGLVRMDSAGIEGLQYIRVKGPVAVNDSVGFDNTNQKADTFLVKNGQPSVGTVLDANAGATVALTRVDRISQGGGTGSVNYRGTYDASLKYNRGDVVRKQTGPAQGAWICVVDNLAAGTDPVFPEPVTTGGTNNWDQFNMGIYIDSRCVGGVTTTLYLNGST